MLKPGRYGLGFDRRGDSGKEQGSDSEAQRHKGHPREASG
jgi:hypothetical protein